MSWCMSCNRANVGAFQFDGLHGIASEGEGACLRFVELVTNLPLRGKLGWMTPRAGVKTTLAMRRAFRGPRSQAGALDFSNRYYRNLL